MKLQGKFVLWPANIDSTKSRKEGRRIPKALAVQSPRLEEIKQVAARLSLDGEFVPGKSRPGIWWERGGYAILPKKDTKTRLLRSLASEIRRDRAAKVEHNKEGTARH